MHADAGYRASELYENAPIVNACIDHVQGTDGGA